MTLDRKDYKTAIPQLEKRLSAVEGQTSKGLAGFDVLQAALEAEKLARQKAVLKVDEGIDLVTVKMFYALVDPNDYVGGLPPASTVWSEIMPEMDAASVIVAGSNPERKRVLWYKSKTLRNGNVVNESPPQQIQLMDGVFSFVNTVASNSGWTTIDGGSITTGIIQASQGDSFFNLNDGTFQVYSSVTGQGMIWNGATLYLGNSTGRHAEIKGGGLYVYYATDDPSTLIAQLGYGATYNSQGQQPNLPYYSLGQRATSTNPDRTKKGSWSVAEGENNQAAGHASHAEGALCDATGHWSHAENLNNHANGNNSFAGGNQSTAGGAGSMARGDHAKANGDYQTAFGVYNKLSGANGQRLGTDIAFMVGNGSGESARHNAFHVTWDGNVYVADHNQHIGHVVSASSNNSITVADIDTFVSGASVTVSAGVFVIYARWGFGTGTGSGAHNREVHIYNGSEILGRCRVYVAARNYGELTTSAIVAPSSNTTYTVRGSASMTCDAQTNNITVVRII